MRSELYFLISERKNRGLLLSFDHLNLLRLNASYIEETAENSRCLVKALQMCIQRFLRVEYFFVFNFSFSLYCYYYFFLIFRERGNTSGREEQRKRENPKHAPHSVLNSYGTLTHDRGIRT